MPERDGDNERKDLTLLTEEQAVTMRAKTYANIPPNTEKQYSDHKIETELFGCSIEGDEIRCSFRVKGHIYRPGVRAKTTGEGHVINVAIPAKVEKRDSRMAEVAPPEYEVG